MTNYLYNYRVLGRVWRGSGRRMTWRQRSSSRTTTGPEDHRYLVHATPSSQLSLASNNDPEDRSPGTRRSSTSSGIGTSQGGESGPEAGGSVKLEFTPLPILAPIKSTTEPEQSVTSALNTPRYVDPRTLGLQPLASDRLQNTAVSLPNPSNWNIDNERTSTARRHGILSPLRPESNKQVVDTQELPPKRKKTKKRPSLSDMLDSCDSEASVPLRTISSGRIKSKLKLSPIPDDSGESKA